jgi:CRP/FNR family cyclic AMP-dependent transcriptional regulator
VLREGEQSRFVALITIGWVAVSIPTSRGDSLILAIRGAGDVIGDMAAFDGRPRSATVTALDDISLVVVAGDRFTGYLTTHPAAAAAYMRNLGARLRDADAERRALVSATVLQRLASLLVELAVQQGVRTAGSITIRPALPQRDLAASIGATREAVAKALRVLRERDVVRTGPQWLVITHPELLELLARS